MEQIEIYITDAAKRAAVRETLNRRTGEVGVLCYNQSTGQSEVRVLKEGDEIDTDTIQIIDLSETAAYGSYIDSVVDPNTRLRVPGHPDILSTWDTDDVDETERVLDEYESLSALDDCGDYDTWIETNRAHLYTLEDITFDIWELITTDVEFDGRYIIVERIEGDGPLPDEEV